MRLLRLPGRHSDTLRELLLSLGRRKAVFLVAAAGLVVFGLTRIERGSFYPRVPRGLPPLETPEGNPLTQAKIELGERLFFDPILSRDRTMSCATCHDPRRGWTNREVREIVVGGRKVRRRVPTLLNVAYHRFFFWDGRAATLEEQVLFPVTSPAEMALPVDQVEKRLREDPGYPGLFRAAFGEDEIRFSSVAMALASYERVILSGDSVYDSRYVYSFADQGGMSSSAQRGERLFLGKAGCVACHDGPDYRDSLFHNTGVGSGARFPDPGRYLVTRDPRDFGAFKTPSLRNLAYAYPYMHDGSLKTLRAVIDFYDRGGVRNAHLDPKIRPLGLSVTEKEELLAFLEALNGAAAGRPSY